MKKYTVKTAFQVNDIFAVWKQPDGSFTAHPIHFAGLVTDKSYNQDEEYVVLFDGICCAKDPEFFPDMHGGKANSFAGYFTKEELEGTGVLFYKFDPKTFKEEKHS